MRSSFIIKKSVNSFDKKFCNCEQTKKYAYNEYDILYDSLFIQLDSQTWVCQNKGRSAKLKIWYSNELL